MHLPHPARRRHRRVAATVVLALATSLLAPAAATARGTGTATGSGRTTANFGMLAARSPQATGRDPGNAEFIGNNFFDECADAVTQDADGPVAPFDLKKFSIVDNQAEDLTFLWGTCPGLPAPTTSGAMVAFLVDDGRQDDFDGPTQVLRQSTVDATWELFATNASDDEADWTLLQAGTGQLTRIGEEDGGPRDVGAIEIDAVAADFPLEYLVELTMVADGNVRDRIPDLGMPPIAFPYSCDFFELRGARIEVADPRGRAVAALATAAVGARGLSRVDGSVLAWPLDDERLAELDALPGIRAVRPSMYRAFGTDPEPTGWALELTRLDRAWGAVPRAAARVAVLDQGVDGARPDLVGQVAQGFNAMTSELFPSGHDSALGPHGTAVSGIINALRGNDVEVAGVNDGATVVPVRVFDHASCADDATIAQGLDWAVSRNVDLVNLSLGGPDDTQTLREAIQRAADAGVIIVAATGNNDETAPGEPSYPAAYGQVIGIGAAGPDGVASYSQRAATEYVAPGGAFSGQRSSDYAVLSEWDRVEFQAGTSFAAPFAVGLISLWLQANPGASTSQVRLALTDAAVDLPGDRDGNGLIDAVHLLGEAPPAVPAAPAVDGDPATSHRLDHDRAIESALAVAALRFPQERTAPVAVLARDDTFADALSGAPLSKDGPLLFTRTDELDPRVVNELLRVLEPGARVHLLGGPGAISEAVEEQLATALPDAEVVRLAGRNRFETSRAIVRATVARHGTANQVLLARGFGPATDPNGSAAWADAIAGASFAASRGWPLLIVPGDGLAEQDLALIDEVVAPGGLVNLLGGPGALSPQVATAAAGVRPARRVAGVNRHETAAAIARTLWGVDATGPRTYLLLNIDAAPGWYLGLASAGYAATIGAPTLAARFDVVPEASRLLLDRCGAAEVELWVAGAPSQISGPTLVEVDRRDGAACP